MIFPQPQGRLVQEDAVGLTRTLSEGIRGYRSLLYTHLHPRTLQTRST